MIKCHYDAKSGTVLGFFDTRSHQNIPTPSLDLETDQHVQVSATPKHYRVNLKTREIEPFTPPGPSLSELRAAALNTARRIVDEAGGAVVGGTPSVIVEGYTSKALDAQQMIAGTATDDIIAAEARVTGEDPTELARLIDAHAKPFRIFSGTVSGAHRVARARISTATDAEEIDAALSELNATCDAALAALAS